MSLLSFLRGLWDGADGVLSREERAAEASESPCYAAVRLVDGRVDAAARQKHLFRGEQWCVRGCGAENPKWRAPSTYTNVAGAFITYVDRDDITGRADETVEVNA